MSAGSGCVWAAVLSTYRIRCVIPAYPIFCLPPSGPGSMGILSEKSFRPAEFHPPSPRRTKRTAAVTVLWRVPGNGLSYRITVPNTGLRRSGFPSSTRMRSMLCKSAVWRSKSLPDRISYLFSKRIRILPFTLRRDRGLGGSGQSSWTGSSGCHRSFMSTKRKHWKPEGAAL